MKTDFSNVIFPDKFRARLDGLDDRHMTGYYWHVSYVNKVVEVNVLTENVGSMILMPFPVIEGIKLNAQRYTLRKKVLQPTFCWNL